MATPEAEAVVVEPRIKPEDLREADPAKRAELLEPYQKDLGTMSSWQVDMAMNQAVIDGVLEVDDDGPEDNVFKGKEVSAKTPDVPEAQAMLKAMRDQRAKALQEEKFATVDTAFKSTADKDRQVDLLVAEIERAFRTHEIDLQPYTPHKAEVEEVEGVVGSKGVPPVKARAYQPEQPEIPAGIKAVTLKEEAIMAAINQVVAELDPDQKDKFDAKLKAMAAQKSEIRKDEETRRTRAGETEKKAAAVRAEAARKAVEAATREKTDKARTEERILTYGLNQEVLKAGTKVENVDPSMRGHVGPDGKWVPARVGYDDKLLVDMNVTSQSVVDEATKINEQRDLERQFGREGAAKELERRETQKQQEAGRLGPNAAREHAEAINETYNHYQRLIDLEPNETIQNELKEARKAAMEAERTRQEGLTQGAATRRAEAATLAEGWRTHSAAKEKSMVTLMGDDPDAEAIATERRRAGNFDPVPILEIKKGGIFARDRYKGPKIIEHTYRSLDKNNKNILMLERRNRRTGKLISQSIFTTEKPLREHRTATGVIELPPREIHDDVDKIRAADKAAMQKSSGSDWGTKSFRDMVHLGFGTGGAFDNDNGILATNIRALPTPTLRDDAANKLKDFKASGRKRRGGWLYWVSGENLPLS